MEHKDQRRGDNAVPEGAPPEFLQLVGRRGKSLHGCVLGSHIQPSRMHAYSLRVSKVLSYKHIVGLDERFLFMSSAFALPFGFKH